MGFWSELRRTKSALNIAEFVSDPQRRRGWGGLHLGRVERDAHRGCPQRANDFPSRGAQQYRRSTPLRGGSPIVPDNIPISASAEGVAPAFSFAQRLSTWP